MTYDENDIVEERRRNRVITNERLISLKTLLGRWRGATETDILDTETTGELVPLWREKTILSPEGKKETWLQPSRLPVFYDFNEAHLSGNDEALLGTVFIESNVISVEKEHPDFLCMRLDTDDSQNETDDVAWDAAGDSDTVSQLLQRIAALENDRDSLAAQIEAQGNRQEESTEWKARYPILAEVVAMVAGGAEEKEIAAFLKTLGVKRATLGALLSHEKTVMQNDTWQRHADSIEGKRGKKKQ